MTTDYYDAMLDLETLGTDPDAVILSAGLVLFNLEEEDDYDTLADSDAKRVWYSTFEPQDQIDLGSTVTFSTIKWWLEQHKLAQAVFHVKHPKPNETILEDLCEFLGDAQEITLWGNGSGFDIPIFRHMFKIYNIKFPFRHWNENDLRTMRRMAGKPELQIVRGVYHNALDDAQYQVLAAQEYNRIVKEGRK